MINIAAEEQKISSAEKQGEKTMFKISSYKNAPEEIEAFSIGLGFMLVKNAPVNKDVYTAVK